MRALRLSEPRATRVALTTHNNEASLSAPLLEADEYARLLSPLLINVAHAATSDDHLVKVEQDGALKLQITVTRASGEPIPYEIHVQADDSQLVAREHPDAEPRRLPSFCPDRHINEDGSFCLFWKQNSRLDLTTEAGAREWLETLVWFLVRQDRAELTRWWPPESAWAHGKAAEYQRVAEQCAAKVSPSLARAMRQGHVSVARGGATLLIDGQRLVARSRDVEGLVRLVNLRAACPCGRRIRGAPVLRRDCREHGKALVALIDSVDKMQAELGRFWQGLRDRRVKCCGTVDSCPLAAAPVDAAATAPAVTAAVRASCRSGSSR